MRFLTLMFLAVFTAIVCAAAYLRRLRKTHFANVGEGTRESGHASLLWDTTTAAALVTATTAAATSQGRFLLVKTSTDGDHITVCGAGDVPLGICQDAYDANNADVPVNVALLGAAAGTQRVISDASAATGNYLKTGANGQATLATTGQAGLFGVAFFGADTTNVAGDLITAITTLPSKLAF